MRIIPVKDRTETLLRRLCEVWERSVRATHLFLTDEAVEEIARHIPRALKEIPYLIVGTDEGRTPVAFMGIAGTKLEMLFVSPEARGKGLGKRLVRYAIRRHSVDEVSVNEQNTYAKGFYEHLGFRSCKRTDTDEQGRPYPLVYMVRRVVKGVSSQRSK